MWKTSLVICICPGLKTLTYSEAVSDGLALLSWSQDSFAYADSYDETLGRYRGLRCCQGMNISEDNLSGLLVRPDVALKQIESETATVLTVIEGPSEDAEKGAGVLPGMGTTAAGGKVVIEVAKPKRFHGSVELEPTRVGRDASRIAEEVIAHLSALVGGYVKVTLEIEATIPQGVPDNVVRTVTENSRTLKFISQGFESE